MAPPGDFGLPPGCNVPGLQENDIVLPHLPNGPYLRTKRGSAGMPEIKKAPVNPFSNSGAQPSRPVPYFDQQYEVHAATTPELPLGPIVPLVPPAAIPHASPPIIPVNQANGTRRPVDRNEMKDGASGRSKQRPQRTDQNEVHWNFVCSDKIPVRVNEKSISTDVSVLEFELPDYTQAPLTYSRAADLLCRVAQETNPQEQPQRAMPLIRPNWAFPSFSEQKGGKVFSELMNYWPVRTRLNPESELRPAIFFTLEFTTREGHVHTFTTFSSPITNYRRMSGIIPQQWFVDVMARWIPFLQEIDRMTELLLQMTVLTASVDSPTSQIRLYPDKFLRNCGSKIQLSSTKSMSGYLAHKVRRIQYGIRYIHSLLRGSTATE